MFYLHDVTQELNYGADTAQNAPSDDDAVELIEDRSLFPRVRTEVRCAACGSHLGHIFKGEGYDVPTDERWCINSVSLILEDI